jgi:hypothetical protein
LDVNRREGVAANVAMVDLVVALRKGRNTSRWERGAARWCEGAPGLLRWVLAVATLVGALAWAGATPESALAWIHRIGWMGFCPRVKFK